jgi:tetratricopeptide (TPR) repeat protein
MMTCSKCQISNPVDSRFCRGCGIAFDESQIVAETAKLDELSSEGFKLFNEGRTDEAKLVSDSVLAELPNHAQALTLKGMCLERADDLTGALEVYERLVEINQDSALDRIKVQHLRQTLAFRALQVEAPPRHAPLMAGIAAFLLVASVGAVFAMLLNSNGRRDESSGLTTNGNSNMVAHNVGTSPGSAQPGPLQIQNEPKQPTQTPSEGRVKPITSEAGAAGSPQTPNGRPGSRTEAEIRPNGELDQLPNTGVAPVTLQGPITVTPAATPPGNTGNTSNPPPKSGDDVPPKIDKPGTGNSGGYVDIKVSSNPNKSGSGSVPIREPQGVEALVRTANQQFLVGKYDQAARTYSEAINQGGASPSVYQRLAQCEEALGKRAEAASAYRKAIALLESRLANGGSARDASALEACRQALKLIEG